MQYVTENERVEERREGGRGEGEGGRQRRTGRQKEDNSRTHLVCGRSFLVGQGGMFRDILAVTHTQ